jgi:hypothetical protein
LYPTVGTTYWDINMRVCGTGGGTDAEYTIYYYGVS